MDIKTEKGLFFLLIGMLISFLSSIILVVNSFISNINQLSPVYLLVSFISFAGGIVSLIGIIFVIISRKEFGEKHSKFVIYSVIIYIVGIIVTTILTSALIYVSISSGITSSMTAQPGSGINYSSYISFSIVLSAVMGGIAIILFLNELEDQKGKIILYSAVAYSIISTIFISIYLFIGLEDINFYSSFDSSSLLTGTTRLGGLSLIGNVLLIIAVYIPYKRIKTGELRPVLPNNQKRCMNCGRVAANDSIICPYCGNRFNNQF